MDVTIKYKAQEKPEDDLVSFSIEDVRVKDLGAVLSRLPEALAKSYTNTRVFQLTKTERICESIEKYILNQSKNAKYTKDEYNNQH